MCACKGVQGVCEGRCECLRVIDEDVCVMCEGMCTFVYVSMQGYVYMTYNI